MVGWSMADYLRTELVVDALEIHHSDQGSQYTGLLFGEHLGEAVVFSPMGRVGSALDNAMAESFISTPKAEMVSRHRSPTREAAKMAIFNYIEGFYNQTRRHPPLGYLGLANYEKSKLLREAMVA
jgi:putative transposase